MVEGVFLGIWCNEIYEIDNSCRRQTGFWFMVVAPREIVVYAIHRNSNVTCSIQNPVFLPVHVYCTVVLYLVVVRAPSLSHLHAGQRFKCTAVQVP